MAEIVVLGGGRDPNDCPVGRSYALVAQGTTYLLDCGDGCGALLRRNGIDPLSVRAVFITHMHYDHMAGLFGFLFGVWAYCRREEDVPEAIRQYSSWGRLPESSLPDLLTVAVPEEAVEALESFLPSVYLAQELWRFPLRILPIRSGLFYQDDVIETSAFPTGHLSSQPLNQVLPAKYPRIKLECFGLTLEVEGLRLVYSADLALAGEAGVEEFRPYAQEADVIITEVAHVPPEYHLAMLAETAATKVILVHVHEKLGSRLQTALQAQDDERFILAHNGMRIPCQRDEGNDKDPDH
jgi:ribonuclease BN (tRNA processing enzyme)